MDEAQQGWNAAVDAARNAEMGVLNEALTKTEDHPSRITVRDLDLFYDDHHALKNVSIDIKDREITSFIGPSGCGKSTLLRCFNRMNDMVKGCRIEGSIELDGQDIYRDYNVTRLRQQVGMVFQRPNPFPMSIYDNVAYGPRGLGIKDRDELDGLVEDSLRRAALWDEVKDKLKQSGLGLSGGQQQRLCIARALAVKLKEDYALVVVTHNMQQASRISNSVAFFLLGELVEHGETGELFRNPRDVRTQDYLTGRFG